MSDDSTIDQDDKLAKAVAKFEDFLANIAVEAIEVGNVRPIHPERMQQAQAMIDKKKKQDDARFRNFLKQINDINERLKAIDIEINDLNNEIIELQKDVDVLEKAAADIQNGILPEMDEDGNFKDPKIAEAVKAWEEKNGKKLDRNDPDALLAAILAARDYKQGQITVRKIKIDELEKEADGLEKKLEGLKAEADVLRPFVQETLKQEDGNEVVNMTTANAVGAEAKAAMDQAKGHKTDSLEELELTRSENDIAAQAGDDSRAENENKDLESRFDAIIGRDEPTNLAPTQPSNIIAADFNIRSAPVNLENLEMDIEVANIEVKEIPAFTLGGSNQIDSQDLTVQTLGA